MKRAARTWRLSNRRRRWRPRLRNHRLWHRLRNHRFLVSPTARPRPRSANGAGPWSIMPAPRQPLTVEGEEIGNFDLLLACGAGPNSYDLSYVERRQDGEHRPLPDALTSITMRLVGGAAATLKVVSSERRKEPDELVTFASGTVPARLIDAFAASGNGR